MSKPTMIGQVLFGKGNKLEKKDTYMKLLNLNPNDPYAREKALGSIGGAVTSHYIVAKGGYYICQR